MMIRGVLGLGLTAGLAACVTPSPPTTVSAGFACIDVAKARGDIPQDDEGFVGLVGGEDVEATVARIAQRFELDEAATGRMRECVETQVLIAELAAEAQAEGEAAFEPDEPVADDPEAEVPAETEGVAEADTDASAEPAPAQ